MKKLILALAICFGLTAYGSNEVKRESTAKVEQVQQQKTSNRVEILYFHGKQRCATCMAIEKNTRELVNTTFAKELKNGTVVFKIVDISTPEGEKIADNYKVTWSSLYVNKWKDGKETRNDMTKFGFSNARKNPDTFKNGVIQKVKSLLK